MKTKMVKEDKRALKKYIVIMIIAFIVGLASGLVSAFAKENLAVVVQNVTTSAITIALPYTLPVTLLVLWIVYIVLYRKSVRLYKTWDGEEEDVIDGVEELLSYVMLVSSIAMILSFTFFAWTFAMEQSVWVSDSPIWALVFVGVFMLTLGSIVYMQYKVVDFEKKINPEKRGSVFDTKFANKWEESCDEAEKMMIYKSAYAAYKAVNSTCIALWLFCALGSHLWSFGMVPVTMVSIVWLVLVVSYTITAIRLSRKDKMEMSE